MSGIEIALLIVLSISVIVLIVALITTLKRLDALSKEATELLKVTRVELTNTLQEFRDTSSNISELIQELSSTVGHVDRAFAAIERFEPAEVAVSVAEKVAHKAEVGVVSLAAGLAGAVRSLRHREKTDSK